MATQAACGVVERGQLRKGAVDRRVHNPAVSPRTWWLAAPPTPFDGRGRVDVGRLRAHLSFLLERGAGGLVVGGWAAEMPYLTDRERSAVHRLALELARGRPVYVYVWDPSPATTDYLVDAAAEAGASGALLPLPLWYRVDDAMVAGVFRRRKWPLPLLVDHGGVVATSPIREASYLALRADGVLSGMLDGSGDLYRLARLGAADPGAVWCGDDRVLARAMRLRGVGGVVSLIANAWPSLVARALADPAVDVALRERAVAVERAGGVFAIKAMLRMGGRAPFDGVTSTSFAGLPEPEEGAL